MTHISAHVGYNVPMMMPMSDHRTLYDTKCGRPQRGGGWPTADRGGGWKMGLFRGRPLWTTPLRTFARWHFLELFQHALQTLPIGDGY